MQRSSVRPPSRRLTDDDARQCLAAGIIRACHTRGPSRVAFEVGCDEKTIRRARDGETTLRIDHVVNLLDVDPDALDELLAAKGKRIVALDAVCDSDALITTSAAVHSIAAARSPLSKGGVQETDCELLAMEDAIDAALSSLEAIKARILRIKLGRAA